MMGVSLCVRAKAGQVGTTQSAGGTMMGVSLRVRAKAGQFGDYAVGGRDTGLGS